MKKKILLFSSELKLAINIFKYFNQKLKNRIIFKAIFTNLENKNLAKINFPNANIYEYPNETNLNSNFSFTSISKIKLKNYKGIFRYFNYMLSYYGFNQKIFSKKEKKIYFKFFTKKILDLLTKYDPNLIVFTHTPHSLFEITLIKVCQDLKIKTIFPRGIPIASYYILQNKINKRTYSNIAQDNYYQLKKNILRNKIKTIKNNKFLNLILITSKITEKNFFYKFLFFIYLYIVYYYNIFKIFIRILLNLFNNKLKSYIYSPDNIKYKLNQNLIENRITNFQLAKIHCEGNKIKFNLLKFYNSKCTIKHKNDLEIRYIFFPLWFGPSSTLYPYADKFLDYLYTISLIQKKLPLNTKLFVQESQDIFNISNHAWFRGNFVRSNDFYQKIYKMKNVFFVNFDLSNDDLIAKSLAVVSLCDKNFIKSYIVGKPTITLGNILLTKQNGFFPSHNELDLKKAMTVISNKVNINLNDKIKFLEKLFLNSFYKETYFKNKFQDYGKKHNPKENAKHISKLYSSLL